MSWEKPEYKIQISSNNNGDTVISQAAAKFQALSWLFYMRYWTK